MDRPTLKYGLTMLACAAIAYFPFVRGTRVPLLGWFDLGMHELGHLLFAWAGETVHFLAGSLVQVIVPAALAGYFWWRRRDPVAVALVGSWTGASLGDVSVYIADAPFERLPLIGGDHDWAFLLHKYDAMHLAGPLANGVRWLGVLVVCGSLVLAARGPRLEGMPRSGDWHPKLLQPSAGAADTPDDPWD